MMKLIGIPEELKDATFVADHYSEITIDATGPFSQNMLSLVTSLNSAQFKFLSKDFRLLAVLQHQDLTSVNAYYSPQLNAMILPLGLFHYDATNDFASLLYGALGSIVGHELAHAFDSESVGYDEYGRRASWLSESQYSIYASKLDCFKAYYQDNFKVGDAAVNGTLTLSENMADHVALQASYQAFQKQNLQELRLPGITYMKEDQLFFLGFAQLWCSSQDSAVISLMNSVDEHTVPKVRVNAALSLLPQFSETWACASNSKMASNAQCRIFKRDNKVNDV
jgi:endothelin-converting enzyme